MFCKNCGRQMNDTDAYCPSCGARNGNGGVSKVKKPSFNSSTHVNAFASSLKTFFSKGYMRGVKTAAESGTYEGVLFALLYYIVFAFSVPLFIVYAVRYALSATISSSAFTYLGDLPTKIFGHTLLWSLVLGLIAIGALAAGVYVYFNLMKVQRRDFMTALNLVTYSSLPVVVAMLVNMILGLIWWPVTLVTSFFGILMQILMIYNGVRAVGKIDRSAVLSFTLLCTAVATVIICVVFGIYTKETVNVIADGAVSSVSGLFDLL